MISDGGEVDLDEEEVHVDWDEEGDEQERGGSEQLVHLKVSLEIISKKTNDREGSPKWKVRPVGQGEGDNLGKKKRES